MGGRQFVFHVVAATTVIVQRGSVIISTARIPRSWSVFCTVARVCVCALVCVFVLGEGCEPPRSSLVDGARSFPTKNFRCFACGNPGHM